MKKKVRIKRNARKGEIGEMVSKEETAIGVLYRVEFPFLFPYTI